jgi:putative tryptophan/tyrosine transport system substrate-binding protein
VWARGNQMKRRAFIGLVGGAAAWPLVASAQQPVAQKRVGILMGTADDADGQERLSAFRRGLQDLNWVEGRNIRYDVRWGAGDAARTKAYAVELVGLAPDLILGTNTPTARSLKQATETIPVVFSGLADPIADGIVANLASPQGNITGFTSFNAAIAGKWLQLLKEIAPATDRVVVIYNPDTANRIFLPVMETVAPQLAITLVHARVTDKGAIENAIQAAADAPGRALMIMPDVFTALHRQTIFDLAINSRLPTVCPLRIFTTAGGLVSYGSNIVGLMRQAAYYADRILRGEKPRDLPVQEPTQYELIINLKTAKALGLTVPPTLLSRADEVIE